MGPYIMGFALTHGAGWSMGYRYISLLQIGLTAILLLSLPLWRGRGGSADGDGAVPGRPLTLAVMVGAHETLLRGKSA